ncbi:hypothetical protein LJK87_45145 [Paenibacillus sp. P25]|nr:hypothetical protein LJK87_45145 [Paenibacillus sp. P25]
MLTDSMPQRWLAQPVLLPGIQAEHTEDAVQQAGFRAVDHAPYHRDDDRRDDDGEEQGGAVDLQASQGAVQQQCEKQSRRQLPQNPAHHHEQVVQNAFPEDPVLQGGDIIIQAQEGHGGQAVPIEERIVEGHRHRNEGDTDIKDQGGQQPDKDRHRHPLRYRHCGPPSLCRFLKRRGRVREQ